MTKDEGQWKPALSRLVFSTEVGSRLFGTNDAKSDLDIRGVWVGRPIETLAHLQVDPDGLDYKIEELRTFLGLLAKGDNNSLEVLFGNRIVYHHCFEPVYENRHMFVSREWFKGVYAFAERARNRVNRDQHHSYLAHALRVVSTAHYAAATGEYEPNVRKQGWSDDKIAEYRAVKRGELSDPAVIERIRDEVTAMAWALDKHGSNLPSIHMGEVNEITLACQTEFWKTEDWDLSDGGLVYGH